MQISWFQLTFGIKARNQLLLCSCEYVAIAAKQIKNKSGALPMKTKMLWKKVTNTAHAKTINFVFERPSGC